MKRTRRLRNPKRIPNTWNPGFKPYQPKEDDETEARPEDCIPPRPHCHSFCNLQLSKVWSHFVIWSSFHCVWFLEVLIYLCFLGSSWVCTRWLLWRFMATTSPGQFGNHSPSQFTRIEIGVVLITFHQIFLRLLWPNWVSENICAKTTYNGE